MRVKTIQGFNESVPCEIFVMYHKDSLGDVGYWYCIKGTRNIKLTLDEIKEGVECASIVNVEKTSKNIASYTVDRDVNTAMEFEEWILIPWHGC
ncbi:hypothetical protein VB638_16735 [Dolichospermum sp. UHCC 0684]|uniref:hypothetical protein n=1 Tax=unclassified Dolichospermum TaxID=2622029 RepID=UPI00144627CB|nr:MULTISPECIES: hypothetical protein [unclassified Dolichospermum]MEA5531193.1 hypothetical protein [Dolichospermum sp. UHCC 0684]MTJ36986.1 hypothetical protein [Dolichospermum sp. UHCC 0260]